MISITAVRFITSDSVHDIVEVLTVKTSQCPKRPSYITDFNQIN